MKKLFISMLLSTALFAQISDVFGVRFGDTPSSYNTRLLANFTYIVNYDSETPIKFDMNYFKTTSVSEKIYLIGAIKTYPHLNACISNKETVKTFLEDKFEISFVKKNEEEDSSYGRETEVHISCKPLDKIGQEFALSLTFSDIVQETQGFLEYALIYRKRPELLTVSDSR